MFRQTDGDTSFTCLRPKADPKMTEPGQNTKRRQKRWNWSPTEVNHPRVPRLPRATRDVNRVVLAPGRAHALLEQATYLTITKHLAPASDGG